MKGRFRIWDEVAKRFKRILARRENMEKAVAVEEAIWLSDA